MGLNVHICELKDLYWMVSETPLGPEICVSDDLWGSSQSTKACIFFPPFKLWKKKSLNHHGNKINQQSVFWLKQKSANV